MDEDSPAAPSSPPLPKKGAYNIDFDNLDEFSNPFESKSNLKMGSSPPVQPSTFDFDENADPFKSKKCLASSPPGSPKETSRSNEISGEPDDADVSIAQTVDQPETPEVPPESASVEEEKSLEQVTPIKKKMIKKPQVRSKFKPPKDMKRNKNNACDIELLMPEKECENNNKIPENTGNDIDFGAPHESEEVTNFHPEATEETSPNTLSNDMKEDGPPPLDAAPEAMAMSSADIDRHFIDKDDDQDDQFVDVSEFKDARDWTSSNMNSLDSSPTASEKGNKETQSSSKAVVEQNLKSENEVGKSSGSDSIKEKHPAARALQAAQAEDPVSIGKMSVIDKKGDMDSSDNKGTVVQLVQVLRYSQTDWNKMKQELELNFQTTLLNKERDWSRLLADRDKKISSLEESNKKLKATKEDMRAVVTEFEKTMAQLQSEKEKMKTESGKKVQDLEGERNQALEDLASVENAFSDLHRRYEKSKTVIEGFKRNEEELKECMEDLKQKLKKSESKLTSLRSQAEEKLDRANEDIDKIKKSTKGEVARLEAALKKSELRISSLDEALSRKEKENQELTAICDELIAKVGS